MMSDYSLSSLRLLVRQISYENRLFRRTAIAAFFTLALPLIFLLFFGSIFDDLDVAPGQVVAAVQFYAPGLAVFSAVSATYTNIGIGTAISRDEGILRRIRSTPIPQWVYMGGVVGSGVLIALFGALIMLVVGFGFFGLEMDTGRVPAAVVTFLVGLASFSLLGLALAAVAPSGQSAPALANATILPLALISNVFVVIPDPARWLDIVGNVFPLKPFVEAFYAAFDPFRTGSAWEPVLLVQIAVWGMLGAVVIIRRFQWEPKVGGRSKSFRVRRIR